MLTFCVLRHLVVFVVKTRSLVDTIRNNLLAFFYNPFSWTNRMQIKWIPTILVVLLKNVERQHLNPLNPFAILLIATIAFYYFVAHLFSYIKNPFYLLVEVNEPNDFKSRL